MPPRLPEPDLQAAARLLAQGRPAEAVEQLAALVAETPVYAAAHVLHATALEADDRPAEALDAWGRAAVLVPTSPLVHRERRRLMEAAHRADEAAADEAAAAETADPEPEAAAPPDLAADDGPVDVYDVRAVDERFLLDEDDEPYEPSSAVYDDASGDRGDQAELLPPEPPGTTPVSRVTAEAPGGAGWVVLAEDDRTDGAESGEALDAEVAPPDAAPAAGVQTEADLESPAHPVADELDALISRLEEAPRIRPDPEFDGPAVSFDGAGTDEVASETLAKIYEAQGQYDQAAEVYETLAAREPDRAADLLARADAVRQKR